MQFIEAFKVNLSCQSSTQMRWRLFLRSVCVGNDCHNPKNCIEKQDQQAKYDFGQFACSLLVNFASQESVESQQSHHDVDSVEKPKIN